MHEFLSPCANRFDCNEQSSIRIIFAHALQHRFPMHSTNVLFWSYVNDFTGKWYSFFTDKTKSRLSYIQSSQSRVNRVNQIWNRFKVWKNPHKIFGIFLNKRQKDFSCIHMNYCCSWMMLLLLHVTVTIIIVIFWSHSIHFSCINFLGESWLPPKKNCKIITAMSFLEYPHPSTYCSLPFIKGEEEKIVFDGI